MFTDHLRFVGVRLLLNLKLMLLTAVMEGLLKMEKDQGIISLVDFKRKKQENAMDQNGLFVTRLNGKLSASSYRKAPGEEALDERLTRIRASLEKINTLMEQLKKLEK